MNCVLFAKMDQVFSKENKTLKKYWKIGEKYWKSQGILSVRKSGNPVTANSFQLFSYLKAAVLFVKYTETNFNKKLNTTSKPLCLNIKI